MSAPQSTVTSGPAAREESACRVRATSSLPVPVSPRTSTEASVGATCSSCAKSRRIGGERPSSSPSACFSLSAPGRSSGQHGERGGAELEAPPERNLEAGEARAEVAGAVLRAEIGDLHARGGELEAQVPAGDAGIGELELAVGVRADEHGAVAHLELQARVGPREHHQPHGDGRRAQQAGIDGVGARLFHGGVP